MRQLQFALSQSFEHNDANIFGYSDIGSYLSSVPANTDLARLLRFPDGPTHAFAQRFVVTWDRRDQPFNPHSGTLLVSGIEHIDWYGEGQTCIPNTSTGAQLCPPTRGHTLHFTETVAVYIPVTKKITWATELRVGINTQIASGATYTDRFFFLGGVDSLRGYLQDSLVPQEYADQIASGTLPFNKITVRGGDLMINPRTELRIPIRPPLDTVLFMDAGNVWLDPSYVFDNGFSLRVTAGTGVRVETPIGPLAFDYGINMSRLFASSTNPRVGYEDFGAFHFAIGLF
jgi:outer membrane protein assembly factor BamA